MERSFRSGLLLIAGIALLVLAASLNAILLEGGLWAGGIALVGAVLTLVGGYALRVELASMLRQRRGEIILYTIGVVGVLMAAAWLSVRFPMRLDMTEEGQFSLAPQTVKMLERLDRPVHIVFFHDPMMRETVELYQQMAAKSPKLTIEYFDPTLNPAQARLMNVQFAGTSIMTSEGRKLQIGSGSEADIANGILRVSRGSTQRICFLEGHGEPDPFSMESHDHMEGAAGHSHGLGTQYVIHEQHGMAKARGALETMNYAVEKVSLARPGDALSGCTVLTVVGPRTEFLPQEISAVRGYLEAGGNAMFMLDPFVKTGLEPVFRELGVVLDDDIVIDEASHFWADPSAPAVSDYNRHQVTQNLPMTFFPGARSLSPTEKKVPGTTIIPLLNSSKQSFGETSPQRANFDKDKDLPGPNTMMVIVTRRPVTADAAAIMRHGIDKPGAAGASADTAGELPKQTRKSRIAIVGDSDFATNSFFHIMGNGSLFLNTMNYLASQENLIGIEARTFDVPRVNMTNRQMKGTFFLAVILVPALLAMLGIAVWWKQK